MVSVRRCSVTVIFTSTLNAICPRFTPPCPPAPSHPQTITTFAIIAPRYTTYCNDNCIKKLQFIVISLLQFLMPIYSYRYFTKTSGKPLEMKYFEFYKFFFVIFCKYVIHIRNFSLSSLIFHARS